MLGFVDTDRVVDGQHDQQNQRRQDAERDAEQPCRARTHQHARGVDDVPLGVHPECDRHGPAENGGDRGRDERRKDVPREQPAREDDDDTDDPVEIVFERREKARGGDEDGPDVHQADRRIVRVLDGLIALFEKGLYQRERTQLHEKKQHHRKPDAAILPRGHIGRRTLGGLAVVFVVDYFA